MIPAFIIAAFLLGFAGSFHCVGMCGPLAMGFVNARSGGILSILLYFAGKTFTYALIGLLFGLIGRQWVIAGWQQSLSIIMGIAMLIIVGLMFLKPSWYHQNRFTQFIATTITQPISLLVHHNNPLSIALLGALNGLLPCGLVYMGIVGALATGNALQGALFMTIFGIGTMPVLLAFLVFSQQFSLSFRNALRRLTPVFIAVVGLLLIMRGLALDIPYLSPVIPAVPAANVADSVIECH